MLKALELFGFKSFADKTVVEFSPGITGVVGPNGSGKSNVVDSIKWLLGDQSAKSLRGKEMTDVIFNGSSSRKPNAFAEATLVFGNESRFLPMDQDEVTVGRRLWRSGDSEYLINRNVVRLKDVRELFMGTGAGAAAYCIIEQGRVGQILQANASNRRLVFEEAAGISRFKSRRAEATRKLERVDQNLLRLTDIVTEVESQLNSIRTQAARATKFREVSTELRDLWVGLAADDYRQWLQQAETVEAQDRESTSQLDELNERQQSLESQLAEFDETIHEIDEQLQSVESEGSIVREKLAGRDATIRHETARLREIDTDLVRLRKQRVVMLRRTEDAKRELRRAEEIREKSSAEFEQIQQEVGERDSQIHELTERLRQNEEQRQSRLAEVERQSEELETQSRETDTLRNRIATVEQSRTALSERLAGYEDRIAECRERCDAAEQRVAAVQAEVDEADRLVRSRHQHREQLIGDQTRFQQTLSDLREQRSGWQARKAVLEDLESRQEGMGIGVREILQRGSTSSTAPWNTIVGSVADLFDVDIEYAPLMEVALGARSQLIVLTEYGPLIDYLNTGRCNIAGRVGFVSLGTTAPDGRQDSGIRYSDGSIDEPGPGSPADRVDLSAEPGVVARADTIVRCADEFTAIAEFLLSDTWIVDTLADALRLAKQIEGTARFVTQQGELLESDGTLYVGTVRTESAVMSRRSELRRLKSDLNRIDRDIRDEESRLAGMDTSISQAMEELESSRSEHQQHVDRLTEARSELLDQQRQLSRLNEETVEIQEDTAGLDSEESQLREALSQADMTHAQLTENLQSLREAIEESERDAARFQHRVQSLERRRTEQQVELTRHEERVSSIRDRFDHQQHDLEQRQQQQYEAERRLRSAVARRREIALNVLNARGAANELALDDERLSARLLKLRREKDAARSLRAQVNEEDVALRARRNELTETHHASLLKSREVRHQMQTLEERIAEEYQLELSEAVADGASAVRLWLEREAAKSSPPAEAGVPDDEPADEDASVAPELDDDDGADDDEEDETDEFTDADAALDDEHELETDSESGPGTDLEDITGHERYQEIRDEVEQQVGKLRRRLKNIGNVSTESIENMDELESRFTHLNNQLQDLVEAKTALEEILRRIDTESRRLFEETFDTIRGHFQYLFRKLFGGGDGDIILEDPEDVLECGIDVVARPPGKELRSITLLSGGEKTMTAVALLMAIFRSRPSPFCILDEVDAALDDANVDRFVGVLREFQETTQFIMITHRKPSMAVADVLYGVTMEESGVSKRLTVRFEDVNDNGEFTGGVDPDEHNKAA